MQVWVPFYLALWASSLTRPFYLISFDQTILLFDQPFYLILFYEASCPKCDQCKVRFVKNQCVPSSATDDQDGGILPRLGFVKNQCEPSKIQDGGARVCTIQDGGVPSKCVSSRMVERKLQIQVWHWSSFARPPAENHTPSFSPLGKTRVLAKRSLQSAVLQSM